MDQQEWQKIASILFIGVVVWVIFWIRDIFRANIKSGDVVGVRFGDYVVNRTVKVVTKYEVLVEDFDRKQMVFVLKDRVYIKDTTGESDVGL